MSIDHSGQTITLSLDEEECAFRPLRPLDLLEVIDWANHRERKAQLELIAPKTAQEAAEALQIIGKPYSLDRINNLLDEPMLLAECLWRCFLHANPGAEREAFFGKLGLLDLPRLIEFFNLLSGYGEESKDPTPAAPESEKKNEVSVKPSPPSVNATD